MALLNILSTARKRAFRQAPKLSTEARNTYFLIDNGTRRILAKLQGDVNKVGFLVQKAYFQAKGCFYEPKHFQRADIKRAMKAVGVRTLVDVSEYRPEARHRHKKMILAHFNWSAYDDGSKVALRDYAENLVAVRQHKEDILFALVAFCWQNKFEIPSYNQLNGIITDAFQDYDRAVLRGVERKINDEQVGALNDYLNSFGADFTVRELKRFAQGENQTSLQLNARLLAFYKEKFFTLLPLISAVNLTDEAVKHFSDTFYLNDLSAIKRLKRNTKTYLDLTSFIKDQFYQRQDFAAASLIKMMRQHISKARGEERKRREESQNETLEANKTVLTSARDSKQVLRLILSITNDGALSDAEKNERTRQLILSFFEAENPLFDDCAERVNASLQKQITQADFYKAIFSKAIVIQRQFGNLVKEMVFDKDSRNKSLLKAVEFYQSEPTSIDENSPVEFLSLSERQRLEDDDEFLPIAKYRVLLLMAMQRALKERSLTLIHSYKHRQPHQYLISDEEWMNHKDRLLRAVSMEKFVDGLSILQEVGVAVTAAFDSVNKRIKNGENPHFKLKDDGTWRIGSPEAEFSIAKVIPNLLASSKTVTLQEIMFEADAYSDISSCFTNRSPKSGKSDIDVRLLFATLLSLGTNLGHTGLARATKLFSEKALRDTESNWITLNNVKKANDRLVKVIQSLNLPAIFNDSKGTLHTSSDGKKVVVNVDSLLANYSYKYYGKEQGISVNSFLDEKQSLFHVNVLTSSDREAPYMLEGMVSSKHTLHREDIDFHLHSTDTHGYTEAVFAGLYFLDVGFAPRIQNVHNQTLYYFENKTKTSHIDSPISPKSPIKQKLILDNWDDILRLMVSMKLERCSPSQMLKILSASEKDSELYKAFKEYGRLLKSHFILTYVDKEELRQSIHKQLNRVELGQKLADAVLFGRKGKLQVGLDNEIQLVAACNTLLRNMIIFWNYLFLSDTCLKIDNEEEREELISSIASGSVIAWAHVNFLGTYEFQPHSRSSFDASFQQMKNIRI